MNNNSLIFKSGGFVAFVWIMMFWGAIGLSIWGLLLAFSAHVILGIVVLFVEPAPFILGLLALFGHPEIAQKIVEWFGNTF